MTPTNEQIQALKGNQVRDSYYLVECGECGEIYPSNKLAGGCQIADTGDYGDCYCPHCDASEEYEDLGNNAASAWNYQQKRIDALLAEREADKALIADLNRALDDANERYENRTPTEWAYEQACAAIEKHRARADNAELEARTLTVNWPDDGMDDCYDLWGSEHCRNNFDCGYNFSAVRHEQALREACAAAGITLKLGEE